MARHTVPIKQLSSGRWQVRYRDEGGRQRAATFRTQRHAKQFLDNTRADLARGVWIDPADSATTFRDYAEQWRDGQVGAYGTAERIEGSLRVHWYPVIGDVPLARLRTTQLQAVVKSLEATLMPSTIGVVVQHLRQVLNGAVIDRMIPTNPAAGLKLPRVTPSEVVIPTPSEVQSIMAAIDERQRGLVAVGAGLGLRQGEAFGLSVDRVNFLRRQVVVDRQLKRSATRSELGALKTANSYRTVPLPSWVGDELARHIERFGNDDPDGLMFVAAMGGRLRRDQWNRRVWKPAVTAAGRPDLGYHSLRHFYASVLIDRKHSPVAVAKRLGNTPTMVLETYSHLWPDVDDLTREAIDAVFAPEVVRL